MPTHADQTPEKKSQSVANEQAPPQHSTEADIQFVDKRSAFTTQRKLQDLANSSPQVAQLSVFQAMADNSPQMKQAAQWQAMADNQSAQQQQSIQRKENFAPIQRLLDRLNVPGQKRPTRTKLVNYHDKRLSPAFAALKQRGDLTVAAVGILKDIRGEKKKWIKKVNKLSPGEDSPELLKEGNLIADRIRIMEDRVAKETMPHWWDMLGVTPGPFEIGLAENAGDPRHSGDHRPAIRAQFTNSGMADPASNEALAKIYRYVVVKGKRELGKSKTDWKLKKFTLLQGDRMTTAAGVVGEFETNYPIVVRKPYDRGEGPWGTAFI